MDCVEWGRNGPMIISRRLSQRGKREWRLAEVIGLGGTNHPTSTDAVSLYALLHVRYLQTCGGMYHAGKSDDALGCMRSIVLTLLCYNGYSRSCYLKIPVRISTRRESCWLVCKWRRAPSQAAVQPGPSRPSPPSLPPSLPTRVSSTLCPPQGSLAHCIARLGNQFIIYIFT